MKFTIECSYNNACFYVQQMFKALEVRPSPNMQRICFYEDGKCVCVYDNRTFKLTVY